MTGSSAALRREVDDELVDGGISGARLGAEFQQQPQQQQRTTGATRR